jgi:hypothetical protein
MYADIRCNEAAFKHGITEANIRYAIWHPVFDIIIEEGVNKNLIVGIDTSGNLLEIMYNEINDQAINVFHAMKCRKAYRAMINL